MIASGLAPSALPAARDARGLPASVHVDVGRGAPERNRCRRAQYALLERGHLLPVQRRLEARAPTLEVLVELAPPRVERRRRLDDPRRPVAGEVAEHAVERLIEVVQVGETGGRAH